MFDEPPMFPLAPWEVPPDFTAPLVSHANATWTGELLGRKECWMVRFVPRVGISDCYDIAVRSTQFDGEGSWWLRRGAHNPRQDFRPTIPKFLRFHLTRARKREPPYRRIYLKRGQRLWSMRLYEKDRSQVTTNEGSCCFKSVWPFDLVTASSDEIFPILPKHGKMTHRPLGSLGAGSLCLRTSDISFS